MRFLIVMSGLLLTVSCIQEEQYIAPEISTQENSLDYFLQTFEAEAALRDINIQLSDIDLTVEISEIHEDHIAGTCAYSSHTGRHITIDKSFWDNSSNLNREMVVFHEIGHCVLGQGHREETDENGNCLSIMQSGTQGCTLLYNNSNRDYFLDELFYFNE